MTENKAIEALIHLLDELPAEFSAGPPSEDSRFSFTVIKPRNVRKVHQALWDLQTYFGLDK